jgi:hypothetical protein
MWQKVAVDVVHLPLRENRNTWSLLVMISQDGQRLVHHMPLPQWP